MAAPDLSLSFTQDVDDINIGTLTDTTDDYGQGAVEARGDAANFPLWSKTDQDGNRVFTNPDPGNVLATMNWSVQTLLDGWYEGMIVRVQPYDNVVAYVPELSSGGIITQYASIVYYPTTGFVYQCIAASTGNLPTDEDFWEVVEDLSTLLDNTNVQVKIQNIYTRPRTSKCVSSKFAKLDDLACDNRNGRLLQTCYLLAGLVISADSEFAQGNPEEMEKIIRQIQGKCGYQT
jgi:hypothetical protein